MTELAPDSPRLDLQAYLARIGYAGDREPCADLLKALHLAHATHIPFENVDVWLKRPVRLDLESLQAKLVRGARGGYCFEQNLLFAAALRELRFSVTPLAARVRYRTQRVLPRTHMALLVDVGGTQWLADVGFGIEGLLLPMPFGDAREVRQFAWTYRIHEQAGVWVLQSLHERAWTDLYAFTLEPQQPADYEMANYYASTHPDSRFVQTLIVQLPTPGARHTLRNRELTVDLGTAVTRRMLSGSDEILEVLAQTFGVRLAAGTRFEFRD